MGAVRAPSSPRFQGVGHQPHGGSPGTLPEPKTKCQPGGGWKQAERVEKSGKEAGVLVSAGSPSRGCLDQVLSPQGTLALPHRGCFWPRAARPCRGQGLCQAGRPLSLALGIPLPRARWERRWGCAGHLLPPSAVGVPHLSPGSQLDEGTDGLVGAGPTGEHMAPVEGLEEANEVGTLRLLEGTCLLMD